MPEPAATVSELARSLEPIIAHHPDPAFLIDPSGVFWAVNPPLCAWLQRSADELLGSVFDPLVAPQDGTHVREQFAQAAQGAPARFRGTGLHPDGGTFLADVTVSPVIIDGEVIAVFGIALDIEDVEDRGVTDRESRELLRMAGRLARFGGWAVDAVTGAVTLSDDTRRMLGWDPIEDIELVDALTLHPEPARTQIAELLARCFSEGEPFEIEADMMTRTGERLRVLSIAEPVFDDTGAVVRAHGAIWDVSEAARSRAHARELEERLATMLNTISDGIFFVDHDWTVAFVNQPGTLLLDSATVEITGKSLWDVLPLAVDSDMRSALESAMSTGQRGEAREYHAPVARWLDITAYPTAGGVAVYLRDVTVDERARIVSRAAQRQVAQQAALLDNAKDAMVVRDLENRVTYWNRAATETYGWTAEEAIGQWAGDLIYSDPAELVLPTETVLREGYWAGELVQRSRDGRTLIMDCRWQLIYDAGGQPASIFAVNTDITDYRREVEARTRAQRMESLGTMAGGIAHDLNNVLTPILMSVQLLAQNETDPSRIELFGGMESAVKRGADMIRQVLSFARGVEGRRVSVDMSQLISDVVAFARTTLPTSIEIVVEQSVDLADTTGDPTQLMQVVVNLVTNAADAMPDGGRLGISAETRDLDRNYTAVNAVARPGRYVVIGIEDSGHGMSTEIAEKIFEPFFTTKSAGRGTGLGLPTSLAIVESHGGLLRLSSEPGAGTHFELALPVALENLATTASPPSAAAEIPRGDDELILVVDDEASIRQITRQTLEAHGYRTLAAAHGREAIDIIENGNERVDLVLTDMMMPIMDGAETTAYLEDHHPEIPIIAASGLSSNSAASRAVGMGVSRFLPKPYTTRLLVTAVHDTLREQRSGTMEGA